MKENLLKIINHYGVSHQLKKLSEEVFELNEAIINYEDEKALKDLLDIRIIDSDINKKKHIEEEFADVMVMLFQFKAYYRLDNERIKEIMNYKIDRQLDRIRSE